MIFDGKIREKYKIRNSKRSLILKIRKKQIILLTYQKNSVSSKMEAKIILNTVETKIIRNGDLDNSQSKAKVIQNGG